MVGFTLYVRRMSAMFGQSTKGRRFPVEILTPEEVRGLMSAAGWDPDQRRERGSTGIRDRALVALMFRGGLRVNELILLEPKDMDGDGTLRVLHAKGGKSRVVGVDEETVALVGLWMARRVELGVAKGAPLFCTLGGRPLSRRNITGKLKMLAERAGIGKRVHPHGLRHSFAVSLVRDGLSMPIVQRALGHSSLATTATYLNHVAPEEVVAALKGRAW
jgi:site-specific recombinase XerD